MLLKLLIKYGLVHLMPPFRLNPRQIFFVNNSFDLLDESPDEAGLGVYAQKGIYQLK